MSIRPFRDRDILPSILYTRIERTKLLLLPVASLLHVKILMPSTNLPMLHTPSRGLVQLPKGQGSMHENLQVTGRDAQQLHEGCSQHRQLPPHFCEQVSTKCVLLTPLQHTHNTHNFMYSTCQWGSIINVVPVASDTNFFMHVCRSCERPWAVSRYQIWMHNLVLTTMNN